MRDSALNTISINELTATSEGKIKLSINSADTSINTENIPILTAGEAVVVKVETVNTNGDVTVYLNNCAFHKNNHSRRRIFDDGESEGDETEDDDIHTGTYTVPSTPGYYHVCIDVIDIFDLSNESSTDNYRAYAWIFPYKVE